MNIFHSSINIGYHVVITPDTYVLKESFTYDTLTLIQSNTTQFMIPCIYGISYKLFTILNN